MVSRRAWIPQVAKTEGFAARLRRVRILVLDAVDQLASVPCFG